VTIANSLFLVFLLVGQNLILDIYKCPKYRYGRAYKTSKNIVFECVSIMLSFLKIGKKLVSILFFVFSKTSKSPIFHGFDPPFSKKGSIMVTIIA
jgi:hypothetical protein